MQPEKRPDGWYLNGRKINVGDVILCRPPGNDPVTRKDVFDAQPHQWDELEVTDFVLNHEHDPHATQERNIDSLVHAGFQFTWPSKS